MENRFEINKAYALSMDENGNFNWHEAATGETGYQCKPAELNALQLAAYKSTAEQIKGYPVRFTHNVNGKPTTIETTLKAVSFDKTNNRATFATASGRAVATFHRFTVLAEVTKTETTTETDNRPAAMIRADIQSVAEKIGRLQTKLATLKEALAAAQIEDLRAVAKAAVTAGFVGFTADNVCHVLFSGATTDGLPMANALAANARIIATIDSDTREDIRYYSAAKSLSPREQRAAAALKGEVGSVVCELVARWDDATLGAALAVSQVIAERGLKVADVDFAALPCPTDTTDTGDKPAKPKRQDKK